MLVSAARPSRNTPNQFQTRRVGQRVTPISATVFYQPQRRTERAARIPNTHIPTDWERGQSPISKRERVTSKLLCRSARHSMPSRALRRTASVLRVTTEAGRRVWIKTASMNMTCLSSTMTGNPCKFIPNRTINPSYLFSRIA